MAQCIDGFSSSIPSGHLSQYQKIANQIAPIYKEYGAIEYQEFVGDDMEQEGTLPFPALLASTHAEIVVLGWIAYQSREARGRINFCIETDDRVAMLVAPHIVPLDRVFNPARMAFGGFRPSIKIIGG